jgi:alkylhydroperoxidase family enzyme
MAMAQGFTREQVQSILNDVENTGLIDEKTRGLLRYAEKVTRNAYKVTQEDMQGLRDLGCSEEEILEGTHVIALFNYMDRMADALGVPVEQFQEAMAQQG